MKLQQLEVVLEAPMPAPDRELSSPEEFEAALAEMTRRFEAARRAMSIVNRMPVGPSKQKNASRVMSNMNALRGYMATLANQLEAMSASD